MRCIKKVMQVREILNNNKKSSEFSRYFSSIITANDPVQVEETVWDNRVRCEHRSLINIAIFLCIIITIPMILSVTIQYVNDAITSQTMFPSYEKDYHRSPSSSLSSGSLRSATTRTSQTMCQPKRRTAKLASRRTATSHTNQR